MLWRGLRQCLFASDANLGKDSGSPLHTAADTQQKTAQRPRRPGRRWLLACVVVICLMAGSVGCPAVYLFAVRRALAFEAWRYGFHLHIGGMKGSVTGPLYLYHTRVTAGDEAGDGAAPSTWLQVDTARTSFDWRHLFWQRDTRMWRDLTLDGVRGEIALPSHPAREQRLAVFFSPRPSGRPPRLVLPASLVVHHAALVIRHSDGALRLQDMDLQADDLKAGHVVIGALSLEGPWMTTLFSNCRGVLELQDSKLLIAGMQLSDSLSITSASADIPDLLQGQLEVEFALAAFSGSIQGDLHSSAREQHLFFESSGTFSNISVAQLAAFLGQDAEGTIKAGKFSFRGSPHVLGKATFTTRFEAGAFRWGARRWNSLVAGATYVNHRLLIPEFNLTQAHNSLLLKGEMSLPTQWTEWWKSDFDFDVAAKIDNLSELSALLGPEFGDTFGKLTADGSVRGENGAFYGQLIVSGSHLSFRKAPLDELQAAIKLDGNEIQVANAEFSHGTDFLRAHGVVNILGRKRYWGEVKASIADLALYSSFLQPPIAPEAFGGGLMLDWSGDGAETAHSGAFTLKLTRVHPLPAPAGPPIDFDAQGTYSPDSIYFSSLTLGDGQAALSARLAVATPASLTLEGIRLVHGKTPVLTGEAQLPLNAWTAWENPQGGGWWNYDHAIAVNLTFDHLAMRDLRQLAGNSRPVEGEVTGTLKSVGTLDHLTAEGHLALRNASAVLGSGTFRNTGAVFDFSPGSLAVTNASGGWAQPGAAVDWAGSAQLSGQGIQSVTVGDLAFKAPAARVPLCAGVDATAALDLHASGSPAALRISGSAQAQALRFAEPLTAAGLGAESGFGLALGPAAFAGPAGWTLHVAVDGTPVVSFPNGSGKAVPALLLSGSLGRPMLAGPVFFPSIEIRDAEARFAITDGRLFLNGADPGASPVALRAAGQVTPPGGAAVPFDFHVFGTAGRKQFAWAPAKADAPPGHAAAQAKAPAVSSLSGTAHSSRP